MPANLLEARSLTMNFGGLTAVVNLSFQILKGELVGLIGPNGAGKTTVFNMLTGVYAPSEGSVYLENELVSSLKPHTITQKGIARTFQNIRLFNDLSVLDNVRIAFHSRSSFPIFDAVFLTPRFFKKEKAIYDNAMELLGIFGLADKKDEKAKNLSYGQMRRELLELQPIPNSCFLTNLQRHEPSKTKNSQSSSPRSGEVRSGDPLIRRHEFGYEAV